MGLNEGDVKLFDTPNNGDICVESGVALLDSGLETALYLSLFGGNEDDSGAKESKLTWWGNYSETVEANKYVSETQHVLKSLPGTTANMGRLKDAVLRDIQWFVDEGIASETGCEIVLPAINSVHIAVAIDYLGTKLNFKFIENWKAAVSNGS